MNQVEMKKRQIECYTNMIGFISLLVLGRILKDEGIACVAVAYESMMFLWYLIGSRASKVLGRMLKSRNGKGQYRNMGIVTKNVGICQGILALAGSVLLILGAENIAGHLFGVKYAASAIAFMAPALFLRTLSATRLGVFQGEGNEMPTVLTGVIRQVLYLAFSLLFSGLLSGYGEKVSHLLGREIFRSMYGSIGVALAMCLTELLILVFLLVPGGRKQKENKAVEGMRTTDSFGGTLRIFYGNMVVEALIHCLKRLPLLVGIILCLRKAAGTESLLGELGVFYGKYIALCGLVILPICAAMTGIYTKVINGWKREEERFAKLYFQCGLHIGVIQGLFFAVFMMVSARQLAGVFCPENQTVLTSMLRYGSAIILFVVLDYFFLQILLLTGRKLQLIGSLVVANILSALVVLFGKGGFLSLVCGLLLGSIVVCLLAGWFCFQIFRSGMDWIQVLAIPVGGVCISGLLGMFLVKVLTPHLGNLVTLLVVFVLAVIVYWIILLFFRNLREQELQLTPFGKLIYSIGHRLHLV